jgi:two-component system cell cycle sensor histidine kinase/response regulator CckA
MSHHTQPSAAPESAPQDDALLRFAGGIAHQLNNALTPLFGHVELSRTADPDALVAHLDAVEEGLRAAAEVVRRLLVVGSRAPRRLKPASPGALVREVAESLRFSASTRVVARVEPSLPTMPLDVELLRASLLELGRNALQVCGPDATVALVARRKLPRDDAGTVEIGVEDDGPGMDDELVDKVIQPYVTTRWNDGAPGLGLAYVAGVARMHGGELHVDSAPGWGTSALLRLPDGGQTDTVTPEANAGARILLVDDDAAILQLATLALSRRGYRVACAAGGQEAIDAHAPGRFDGVLLDLTMPGMGGAEVLTALKARDPDLPVVIWTGHASDADARNLLRLGAERILAKPFSVQQLLEAVAPFRRIARQA